jgi:hypothetical protein
METTMTQDFIETMSRSNAQALAEALGPYLSGEKHVEYKGYVPNGLGHLQNYKATGNPSSDAYLYVNGGLFGRCDGNPVLVNALVGPIGFESVLDWVGTNTEREFFDAWTGIPDTGNEQSTACGDCPTVDLQACAQFYCFGRFCRQTQELQFDRIGLHGNGSIPKKVLFGNITDASGNVLIRQGETIENIFQVQVAAAGYHLALKNSELLWAGDPCNNSGSYMEYIGFQNIINTGKLDAYTQLACDAMDSFLMDMNFQNFTTDGALAVRRWFKRVVDQLKMRANRAGLDWNSAEMYIVMQDDLWDLCSVGETNNRNVSSSDQAQARYEEYLSREALPIGGRWYPVMLDSQIPETTGQANGICSDIYFITTRISGETVTWGQYQDFNQTYGKVRQEMISVFGSDDIGITDNGRFALVRDNSRGCFDVQILTKPRIISTMPWLSGRIQNVCCDVLQQPFPDPSGSDGVYELDGGRSTTPIPVLYGDCIDC